MRNNTAIYQQFQQIIAKQGCPICGLSEHAVHTYLDTLLWESSTDVNLHTMLVASLGFCGRHSRQLLTFGGQRLAAAVIERASLLAAIQRLPELAAATVEPPRVRFRFGHAWSRTKDQPARLGLPTSIQPCPACVRQFAEEARAIEVLLLHLDEFSGPLLNAGGLCLPHFVQTTRAADVSARAALLAIQQKAWTDLTEHLDDFIRKHMDQHHTEPIDDQARLAVERTIAGLTGEYPVR